MVTCLPQYGVTLSRKAGGPSKTLLDDCQSKGFVPKPIPKIWRARAMQIDLQQKKLGYMYHDCKLVLTVVVAHKEPDGVLDEQMAQQARCTLVIWRTNRKTKVKFKWGKPRRPVWCNTPAGKQGLVKLVFGRGRGQKLRYQFDCALG